MKKRRRFIPSDQARAAVLGGFYKQIPIPEQFTCNVCGEERNSIGQPPLPIGKADAGTGAGLGSNEKGGLPRSHFSLSVVLMLLQSLHAVAN